MVHSTGKSLKYPRYDEISPRKNLKPLPEIMSNILNTEEEVRNFLLSSPVEDVDPSAHLFVAVIKARLKMVQIRAI